MNARVRAAAVMLLVLIAGEANAHQFVHPKLLRMGVREDRVLLQLTYDVNPGQDSRMHRSLFDRDSNGTLDAAEQSKLERYLIDTALLFLSLRVGGSTVALERIESRGSGLDQAASSTETLGVAMVLSAPLPAVTAFALEIADRDKDRAKHVPLIVDLQPGYEVAFASQGELFPDVRQIHRIMLREGAPLVLRLRRSR